MKKQIKLVVYKSCGGGGWLLSITNFNADQMLLHQDRTPEKCKEVAELLFRRDLEWVEDRKDIGYFTAEIILDLSVPVRV